MQIMKNINNKISLKKFVIIIVVLLLTIFMVSCNDNEIDNPDDPIDDPELIDPDTVEIGEIDNGTRRKKALDLIDEEDFSASVFVSRFTFDYVFIYAKDRYGNLINDIFDYEAYLDGKKYEECFFDTTSSKEEEQSIYSELKQLKANLLNGAYINYGYDKDMDFLDFCKSLFGNYYGYEVNGINDVCIYFLYQKIMSKFYSEVCNLNNINDDYVKIRYAKDIDNYFYASGWHLLICKKEEGQLSYLDNWSDEDKETAQELYNKIINIIKKIEQYDNKEELEEKGYNIYDFCVKLSDLFSNANFSEVGDALSFYFGLDMETGADFEPYFLNNYSVVCEMLEIEPNVMVEEFEAGVRKIIEANLDEALEKRKIERDVYFYDAIISPFGYHFYVNNIIDFSNIYADGRFLDVPSKVHFAFFLDEYYNQSTEGYTFPVSYYVKYLRALKNNDNDEIDKVINDIYEFMKSLKLDMLEEVNLTNIKEEFIDKYLRTYTNYDYLLLDSSEEEVDLDTIVASVNVNHSIQAFYIAIYNEYAGDTYYMYKILEGSIEELSKVDLKNRKESIDDMIDYYHNRYVQALDLILINEKIELMNGVIERINKPVYDWMVEYFSKYNDGSN